MSRITRVKVMWDYGAFPLWDMSPGEERCMIGEDELAISTGLRDDLQAWCDEWSDLVWGADGPDTYQGDPAAEQALTDRGRALAYRLKHECPELVVTYRYDVDEEDDMIEENVE